MINYSTDQIVTTNRICSKSIFDAFNEVIIDIKSGGFAAAGIVIKNEVTGTVETIYFMR